MMRIGIGYDLHRLTQDRPLILGGLNIPCPRGLQGHSDADVLTHAVIDALLGALALGNIGQHFPDTDRKYKDADSIALLADTCAKVRDAGYALANLDANIIAQQPELNPHIDEMRAAIADCLDVAVDCVSIKAKTNEGLGPEGRGEAISAQAVVLLRRIP